MHILHNLCMINHDISARALVTAARARALGITQTQIALAINADQSQVSRVLSGNSKRASRVFNEVCNYVNNFSTPQLSTSITNKKILDAIEAVWDGTEEHAIALSNVIKSLGAFNRSTIKQASK